MKPLNPCIKDFIGSVLVTGIILFVAGMVSGCASGKHGGGIGGTGGTVAGKPGGGIGGTGGTVAGNSGGGIGGTGNLIAEGGGGIGGTGLQAPDLFGGGLQVPAPPSSPVETPQVVQRPETPEAPQPNVPQTVPSPNTPNTPDTQIARDTPRAPNPVAQINPNVAPERIEPGAGIPAGGGDVRGDDFRTPETPQMTPALPGEFDVPPEMMEQPQGMIICPDLIRMDPNCQAPRPGR